MTGDGPKIVIEGKREDWPGGPRTLTPREASRTVSWSLTSTASRFWSPMTAIGREDRALR